jgi:hypothetical protein
MSSAIIFPKDFKTSNVTISPLKVMDSGAKFAGILYDSASLKMQVSSIPIPYGMSVFDKAGPVKYSVDLSMKGYDVEGSKMKILYDAFTSLDEYMIEMGVNNSKAWFKSSLTRDVVKAFYTPIVRFSRDAEGNPKPYPPTVKIQLKQRDGKFDIYIVDDKKRPLPDIPLEDVLVKGSIITSIIQCTGVWFAGSKYGLSWKAVQIKTDHLPESIRGCAIRDEDDVNDISGALATTKISTPTASASKNKFAELAEDDEVDDEEAIVAPTKAAAPPSTATIAEDEDEDDVIEPVAVPKKPTVVTKKTITKSIGVKK